MIRRIETEPHYNDAMLSRPPSKLVSVSLVLVGLPLTGVALVYDLLGRSENLGLSAVQLVLAVLGVAFVALGTTRLVFADRRLSLRSPRLILKPALVLGGLLLGVLLAEGGMRAADGLRELFREPARPESVHHPRLGTTLVPSTGGVDAWGFNNDVVPESSEIVVIGDSQTWGYWAKREDAWPQSLERRLGGVAVYNISMGGFGPVEYAELIERAFQLSPRLIVVGLYLGNDIWGAYETVYCNDNYRQLRRADFPDCRGIGDRAVSVTENKRAFETAYRESRRYGWRVWLLEHSAICEFLMRRGLWNTASIAGFDVGKLWAQEHPDFGAFYEHEGVRTVFRPAVHRLTLGFDDPLVKEGLRITVNRINSMKTLSEERGAAFGVLVIPSKLWAHAKVMEEVGSPAASFREAVGNENARL